MNYLSAFIDRIEAIVLNKKFIYLIFLVSVSFLFYKRFVWDRGISPLIQSDSQIKLYQTIEYKNSGINSHKCFEIEKHFDEKYEFYPFRYPWAFFSLDEKGGVNCVFQYPSFFAQFFSILPISYVYYNLVILFLYCILCFLVIFVIQKLYGIQKLEILVFAGIYFLVGYGITSAFEFSESVPSHILLLFFFYSVFVLKSKREMQFASVILFGFLGGISVFLRSESLIYIGSTGLIILWFRYKNFSSLIHLYLPLLLGFGLSLSLFAFYNYLQFGEFLGVRSKVSLIDFSRLDVSARIHLISEFFIGNENRIGFLFYCFPNIILICFSLWKLKLNLFQKELLYIIIFSFFAIIILSPYSSGGLYAGMRFTEFTYLLVTIYVFSLYTNAKERYHRQFIFFLILLQILVGVFHVRKNIRNLDFVKKYHEIFQAKLDLFPDAPVLHLSTFDLLLISDSFLKKPHWIVNDQSKFEKIESKFVQSKVKRFQVFFYDYTPPKDDNVTEDFYNEWVDTKFEIHSKYFSIRSDEKIAGFRLMLWERK